jgi:hypothetical protein
MRQSPGFCLCLAASYCRFTGNSDKVLVGLDLWLITCCHRRSGILRNGQVDWHTVPIVFCLGTSCSEVSSCLRFSIPRPLAFP